MVDLERMRTFGPEGVREILGDGNFGGYYQRSDEDMQAIWAVAVDETRALIENLVMNEQAPILIWGAGAIGGTLGAYLARAGEDVAARRHRRAACGGHEARLAFSSRGPSRPSGSP